MCNNFSTFKEAVLEISDFKTILSSKYILEWCEYIVCIAWTTSLSWGECKHIIVYWKLCDF